MKEDLRKYTRRRVILMDYYSIERKNLENFLKKFPQDEKEIGIYIYKRLDTFPDLFENYKKIKSLIEKILKSLGYDDKYIKSYINKNKILFLQSPEGIYRRLAILTTFGMDERVIMEDVSLLTNYNDTMIYLAAKSVREQKNKLYEIWKKEQELKERERALRKREQVLNCDKSFDDEIDEDDESFDFGIYPEDIRNYICNSVLNDTKLTSFKIDSLTRRYVQTKTF